ncbi:MAG: DinB family protein [Chitinophagaceae bacterium]
MPGKILSELFIEQRIGEVEDLINLTKEIGNKYSMQNILSNSQTGTWSVAQVFAHLNSYNKYYLVAIETSLNKTSGKEQKEYYRPGILGAYFTGLMLPAAETKKFRKMKSPKDHIPPNKLNAESVISEFIEGEKTLLKQLENSKKVNLMKTRVPISLNRFIKLQLGDTFHFLVAHQQRHFVQIQTILKNIDSK